MKINYLLAILCFSTAQSIIQAKKKLKHLVFIMLSYLANLCLHKRWNIKKIIKSIRKSQKLFNNRIEVSYHSFFQNKSYKERQRITQVVEEFVPKSSWGNESPLGQVPTVENNHFTCSQNLFSLRDGFFWLWCTVHLMTEPHSSFRSKSWAEVRDNLVDSGWGSVEHNYGIILSLPSPIIFLSRS